MKSIKYVFSPKIKYKTFLKVWNLFPTGGICPVNFDKIVFSLLKEHRLNIGIDTRNKSDPVCFSLKLPKGKTILIK